MLLKVVLLPIVFVPHLKMSNPEKELLEASEKALNALNEIPNKRLSDGTTTYELASLLTEIFEEAKKAQQDITTLLSDD